MTTELALSSDSFNFNWEATLPSVTKTAARKYQNSATAASTP